MGGRSTLGGVRSSSGSSSSSSSISFSGSGSSRIFPALGLYPNAPEDIYFDEVVMYRAVYDVVKLPKLISNF